MHERTRLLSTAVIASLGVAGFASMPAKAGSPAINQFEVKGLDIDKGEVEIEDQSDFIVSGPPRRKFTTGADGETEFDDNEVARQRHAVEMGFGLADWLRVGAGIEFEQQRFDAPPSFAQAETFTDLTLTEVDLEGVVVLIPVKDNGLGLGLAADLQLPRGDAPRTLFIGPIVQAVSGPWSATGNFEFVKFMGGAQPVEETASGEERTLPRDEKWDFAYFTQVKYQAFEKVAFAVEAYGTIDRIGNSGYASPATRAIGDQDQHRIGPVAYFSWSREGKAETKDNDNEDEKKGGDGVENVTLGVGVLFGLNDNTPDTTVKTGLEIGF